MVSFRVAWERWAAMEWSLFSATQPPENVVDARGVGWLIKSAKSVAVASEKPFSSASNLKWDDSRFNEGQSVLVFFNALYRPKLFINGVYH
jgi:hypothetical protein